MGRGCDPPSERPARWHPEGCPCNDRQPGQHLLAASRATRGRHITRCPPQPGSYRVRAPKADGPAIRHRPNRHQATAKMKALAGSDTPAHPPLARGTRGRRPFLSSVLQRRENRVRKSYSMAMNAVSVGNRAPAQAGTQVKRRSACNPGLLPAQAHRRLIGSARISTGDPRARARYSPRTRGKRAAASNSSRSIWPRT